MEYFTKIDKYEFEARYMPSILFIMLVMIEYFGQIIMNNIEVDTWISKTLKVGGITTIIFLLAMFPKFIFQIISKEIEQILWGKYGNPTINYIKNSPDPLINKLLIGQTELELLQKLKASTRNDEKLQSKNRIYGFFRNFSIGMFVFFFMNLVLAKSNFLIISISLLLLSIISIFIATNQYARQIVDSYLENQLK